MAPRNVPWRHESASDTSGTTEARRPPNRIASIGTPAGSSHSLAMDGHCAAGAVKRAFGCAAGRPDDGDGRLLMPQLPRRFDSVDARHVDVHDDDFRLEGLGQSNRLFPVSSLPHHLDIRVGVEHAPETLPYHRVIIRQQDADDRILVESCVPAAEC